MADMNFNTIQKAMDILSQDRWPQFIEENNQMNRLLKALDDAWNERVKTVDFFGQKITFISDVRLPPDSFFIYQAIGNPNGRPQGQ